MRQSFSSLFKLWSIRLVFTGALFMWLGSGLNFLVIKSNCNAMPVATTRADILFVIGPKEYLEGFEMYSEMDTVHKKMTSTDKFSYLSDRILIIPSDTSAVFENICTIIRMTRLCPLSTSLRMASIGNLLIWTGIPFLILSLLVLCIKTTCEFIAFCINKTTRI